MNSEYGRGINSRSCGAECRVGLAAILSTLKDGVGKIHYDIVLPVKAPKLPDSVFGRVSAPEKAGVFRTVYEVARGSGAKPMRTKHLARRLELDRRIAGDVGLSIMKEEAVGRVREALEGRLRNVARRKASRPEKFIR